MDNRQLLETVLQAFDNNDSVGLINLVTDDFTWEMVGDMTIKGKENLKKMFDDAKDQPKMIGSTKDFKIIEGDCAACNGIVTMESAKGERSEMYYCDLYEFEAGKLKRMITFAKSKKD